MNSTPKLAMSRRRGFNAGHPLRSVAFSSLWNDRVRNDIRRLRQVPGQKHELPHSVRSQTAGRILPVKSPELLVYRRVFLAYCLRNLEKCLAEYREKLGRVLRGVGIDRS